MPRDVYSQYVEAVFPPVNNVTDRFAYKMQAQAANFTLVQRHMDVRFGRLRRIEWMPVIFQLQADSVREQREVHRDLVRTRVVVAVFDDVGDNFLNGQINSKKAFSFMINWCFWSIDIFCFFFIAAK